MLVNLIMWCDILLSKKSKSIGPTTVEHYISEFYIHGSVHRDFILIRSNEMQQYAGVYLL